MSMNLNASTRTCKIDLWQTPTQISYTILPTREAKGTKAKEALLRYLEWVRYSPNGAYSTKEQADEARQSANSHVEYVTKFIDDKTLRVWVM